jgi:LicD family
VLGRRALLFQNLSDVQEVFDRAGIRFWLDFGTLLGAVREDRIIEWDDDIDIGTMSDNWDSILRIIPELQNRGFCAFSSLLRIRGDLFYRKVWFERYGLAVEMTVYQNVAENSIAYDMVRRKNARLLRLSHLSLQLSHFIRIAYVLILMIFSTNTRFHPKLAGDKKNSALYSTSIKLVGGILNSSPYKPEFPSYICRFVYRLGRVAGIRFTLYMVPSRFFERLTPIKFLGLEFKAPSDVEEYLRHHYGDWRKRKRDWDWYIDDGSLIAYVQQDIVGSTC